MQLPTLLCLVHQRKSYDIMSHSLTGKVNLLDERSLLGERNAGFLVSSTLMIRDVLSKLAMHRAGYRWSPVRTLPVAPLWCDLVPNSRGNKAPDQRAGQLVASD